MEARAPSRWLRGFVALAWITMGLGGIQVLVGGVDWTVIVPGFSILVLFALPDWLHELGITRTRPLDS